MLKNCNRMQKIVIARKKIVIAKQCNRMQKIVIAHQKIVIAKNCNDMLTKYNRMQKNSNRMQKKI